MAVTCYLSGRWGNIVFHLAQMIAYAKKHGFSYYIPTTAEAYRHFRDGDVSVPFYIKSTGPEPIHPRIYNEPDCVDGIPRYHDIPKMDNVKFFGYYQSFLYFDWCRDYILKTFNFPYKKEKGVTSISVRRGDCVGVKAFPIAPLEYYQNAVRFMQEKGFNKFKLHSDDLEWSKRHFVKENFGDAEIEFYEGHSESENFFSLMGCENNITARSTFSLTAAWCNRNPSKIVCVPTTKHPWWRTQNADLIPPYFNQIDFIKPE